MQEEFRDALPRLSSAARLCREAGYRSARELDSDHVGTEHLVVGLFDGSRTLNDALRSLGITRRLFVQTLGPEEGSYPSHHGVTPETVRVMKIVTLAAKRAPRGRDIEPEHLLLGVVDESRIWIETDCGTEGPHHLADAAMRVGATLGSVERLALSLCDAAGVDVVVMEGHCSGGS